MVPKTGLFTEGRVVQLFELHFSVRKIVAMLENSPNKLGKSAVERIIREHKEKIAGRTPRERKLPEQNLPDVRTPEAIQKVAVFVYRKNPPTQMAMAANLGMSVSSVNRIIHVDLGLHTRKKTTTHHLTETQAAQRVIRGEIFLNYLGMYKTRLIFTMDETMITLNDFDKDNPIYYVGEDLEIPEEWRKKSVSSWPKQLMVAFGICWNGVSRAYFVEKNAKINSEYFVANILKPMIAYDIPRLYPGRENDVILHMDSAPAHKANNTVQYLTNVGQTYIPEGEWMANSPDLAPLDYCVNGILKSRISRRKPTTVPGMKRVIRQEIAGLDLSVIRAALSAWEGRVQEMVKCDGYQIEHFMKR